MTTSTSVKHLDAPFPWEEYEERRARLEAEMANRGLDSLVVWQRSGGSYDRASAVFWLTNFGSVSSGQETSLSANKIGRAYAALVLRRGERPELHIADPTDSTDLPQIAIEDADIYGHNDLPRGLAERLRTILDGKVIGYYGDDFVPVSYQRSIEAIAPSIRWAPNDDIIPWIQKVKSPLELEAYREAGVVTTEALDALMYGLIEGQTESAAAGKAAEIVTRAGGGFQRIGANHGPHTAIWSHGLYGNRPIAPKKGDMVRGWVYGPILHGLWLDPGRPAVCGNEPTPGQRKLIETVAGLMDDVTAQVRPGTTPREVGRFCDELIAKTGYAGSGGPAPWPIFGHSVGTFFIPPYIPAGLALDQEPHPDQRANEQFEEGMVYTVEMFIGDPDVGTATYEDVFIIGRDGNELLSKTPKVFW